MHLVPSTCVLLLTLASSILLSEGNKRCQLRILRKCISQYKEHIKSEQPDPSDQQLHCSRVQKVSSCLAEHPLCKGPSVNLFRLWVLRETKLEKRLNICPDVDSKDLENSVSNTEEAQEHGVEDGAVDANKAECARKIHLKCSKLFLEALSENEKICSDARVWFDCYKTENENGCNANIIDRYAQFVGRVKERLENYCRRVEL
ncbi:unnamed protein product [Porites evermanni]|uniref:Secreted protein n=1 Tax=Porites evermanni TaxID=104178 RepID=A0ABN8LKY4_9CNID|nr:unnamed protein product [Porites evermanni]